MGNETSNDEFLEQMHETVKKTQFNENIKSVFCTYSNITKRSAYKMATQVYTDANIYFSDTVPPEEEGKKDVWIITNEMGTFIWSNNYH